MTKARTENQKRRERQARRNEEANARVFGRPLVEGPREASGRPQRTTAAIRNVLLVRARLAGIDVPPGPDGKPKLSEELSRRLSQQWMGCNAGRAIEELEPSERKDLWGVISSVRKAYARYWRALGIPAPYPASARMLYADTPPDEVASDEHRLANAGLSIEEECKAATNAMMLWEMKLGIVRWAKACILDDERVRDRDEFLRCLRSTQTS